MLSDMNSDDVCYQTSVVCYQPSDFWFKTTVKRRLISDVRHLLSDVWFFMSDICYQTSDFWCQKSVIRRLIVDFRHLLSDVWCLLCDQKSDVWFLMSGICYHMSDFWCQTCYQTWILMNSVIRRLMSCQISHLIFYFRQLLSDVWFLMAGICYQMSDFWCQTFVIRRLIFISDICYRTSDFWCQTSVIRRLVLDFRHLLSDV